MKTRKELTKTIAIMGVPTGFCVLCHGSDDGIGEIKHDPGCILANLRVTHIAMSGYEAVVVIRGRHGGKLYWTSTGSGKTYDIERIGRGNYVMHERKTGKALRAETRLRDIRKFIMDNQGVL